MIFHVIMLNQYVCYYYTHHEIHVQHHTATVLSVNMSLHVTCLLIANDDNSCQLAKTETLLLNEYFAEPRAYLGEGGGGGLQYCGVLLFHW